MHAQRFFFYLITRLGVPQSLLAPSAERLDSWYGEEGHAQRPADWAVRPLLRSFRVLGRRSLKATGPGELGLVEGHWVGDGTSAMKYVEEQICTLLPWNIREVAQGQANRDVEQCQSRRTSTTTHRRSHAN